MMVTPNQPPELPPTHPAYEEAETDSVLIIKFVGNTPMIHEIRMFGTAPEHLAAASMRLRYEYEKMQRISDARNTKMGIHTTDKMPDDEDKPGVIKP